MPEISRFYGIVIKMYFGDHLPPHFHAEYGAHEAVLSIETLAVIEGKLPPRAAGLVTEWVLLHQQELREAWKRRKAFSRRGESLRCRKLYAITNRRMLEPAAEPQRESADRVFDGGRSGSSLDN